MVYLGPFVGCSFLLIHVLASCLRIVDRHPVVLAIIWLPDALRLRVAVQAGQHWSDFMSSSKWYWAESGEL